MTNNAKDKLMSFMLVLLIVIVSIIIVALIILEIYCWIKYGNLPADEVPSWVHWLMWRR